MYINTVMVSLSRQPRVPDGLLDNAVIGQETEGNFGLVGACHCGLSGGTIRVVGWVSSNFLHLTSV